MNGSAVAAATLAEVEAREQAWREAIARRLREGPAATYELAAVCGVTGARFYHRFKKLLTEPGIKRVGVTEGPSGHQNIVWDLDK